MFPKATLIKIPMAVININSEMDVQDAIRAEAALISFLRGSEDVPRAACSVVLPFQHIVMAEMIEPYAVAAARAPGCGISPRSTAAFVANEQDVTASRLRAQGTGTKGRDRIPTPTSKG